MTASTLACIRALAGAIAIGAASLAGAQAPLFDGMGDHTRAVSTDDELAQRYFDQGLVWMYAFNHDEAIRSFTEAARLDPNLAVAWWGVALCHGPHINFPMVPPDRAKAAWDALQKAVALIDHASPVEADLIRALEHRYAMPQPEDRSELDIAYASAMYDLYRKYPDDLDIGTMAVEALMDLQPWDLWNDDGTPKGRTNHIIDMLEGIRAKNPDHPGANHLYIHCVEASPDPYRGLDAADRLRAAVPAAGHLLHMPSHIDVQTGRWPQATIANERAQVADTAYRKISGTQGLWAMYMAHNDHMRAFANMMQGRSADSIDAAQAMVAAVPDEFIRESGVFVDPYMGVVFEVQMRFGKWDDILAYPEPPAELPITRALWRYTRAVAYAAKGEISNAEAERARFHEACAEVPEDAIMGINPAAKILIIAGHMLEGEIHLAQGDLDASIEELRKAVAVEDTLMYMEPPDWIQPVRHTLGAVLAKAERWEEAEAVHRKDLEHWPENGWSLYGVANALEKQGKTADAAPYRERFEAAWSNADITIGTTCACVEAFR
ncbi:MAG: hypothetical protein ACF8QF_14365 [Phycisphaerales bacterium]